MLSAKRQYLLFLMCGMGIAALLRVLLTTEYYLLCPKDRNKGFETEEAQSLRHSMKELTSADIQAIRLRVIHEEDSLGCETCRVEWAAGYLIEREIIRTLSKRQSMRLPAYSNGTDDAHVIIIGHHATALMHGLIPNKNSTMKQIQPESTSRPYLDMILDGTRLKLHQKVAMVFAHDMGRKLASVKHRSDIIAIQNRGDYDDDFLAHNTIVVPPYNFLRAGVPKHWTHRVRKVFWAGATHSNKLRKKLAAIYFNYSSFVEYNNEHVKDWYQRISSHLWCLYLPGYAQWSHRLADIIERACIPVIVQDKGFLPLEDVLEWPRFSILMTEKEALAGDLPSMLAAQSNETISAMHEQLLAVRKRLYTNGSNAGYASWFAETIERKLAQIYSSRYSSVRQQPAASSP